MPCLEERTILLCDAHFDEHLTKTRWEKSWSFAAVRTYQHCVGVATMTEATHKHCPWYPSESRGVTQSRPMPFVWVCRLSTRIHYNLCRQTSQKERFKKNMAMGQCILTYPSTGLWAQEHSSCICLHCISAVTGFHF